MNPGHIWLNAKWGANRPAIYRALKINAAEPGAAYATGPFAILEHDAGHWIAGAVGIWRAFKPSGWSVDDISDVVLWNPRTNQVRLLGAPSPAVVVPDRVEARLPVYADGFSFFRAWADRRAEIFARMRLAHDAHKVSTVEPRDSAIPGALAIGDLNKIHWRDLGAAVLVAGPGVVAKDLNRAVLRSAHLPRVESMAA